MDLFGVFGRCQIIFAGDDFAPGFCLQFQPGFFGDASVESHENAVSPRAGVGTIGIIDGDVVDITNLQRQIIHTTADINRAKVISAKEK